MSNRPKKSISMKLAKSNVQNEKPNLFFSKQILQGTSCQGFCSAALLFLFPPDAFAGIKWDQNYWASSRRKSVST